METMTKSTSDERFQQGDMLIENISSDQFERLKRVGDLWRSQLADWEDLAKAEDSVRREYTGRYLFELLQNANDAILDWYEANNLLPWEKPSRVLNRVRLVLTQKSLLVANDGLPFGELRSRYMGKG
jgi:hypothetical protein